MSPLVGFELNTTFSVEAKSWTDDPTDKPLLCARSPRGSDPADNRACVRRNQPCASIRINRRLCMKDIGSRADSGTRFSRGESRRTAHSGPKWSWRCPPCSRRPPPSSRAASARRRRVLSPVCLIAVDRLFHCPPPSFRTASACGHDTDRQRCQVGHGACGTRAITPLATPSTLPHHSPPATPPSHQPLTRMCFIAVARILEGRRPSV